MERSQQSFQPQQNNLGQRNNYQQQQQQKDWQNQVSHQQSFQPSQPISQSYHLSQQQLYQQYPHQSNYANDHFYSQSQPQQYAYMKGNTNTYNQTYNTKDNFNSRGNPYNQANNYYNEQVEYYPPNQNENYAMNYLDQRQYIQENRFSGQEEFKSSQEMEQEHTFNMKSISHPIQLGFPNQNASHDISETAKPVEKEEYESDDNITPNPDSDPAKPCSSSSLKRGHKDEENSNSLYDSSIRDPLEVNIFRCEEVMKFLSSSPELTQQNIESWHEGIIQQHAKIAQLTKTYGTDASKEIELKRLCELQEDIRIKFDEIISQKFPQLKSQLKGHFVKSLPNEAHAAQRIATMRFFNYGEPIQAKEDRQIEFKNYQLQSLEHKNPYFRDTLKKTIVSFLNEQGGAIYMGVRDYDGTVQGVDLTRKEQDMLKLRITEIRRQIEPDCNNLVNIDFMPVKKWEKFAPGKWVVRIRVDQGNPKAMYAYEQSEDKYLFSSAFREDGSTQRYDLSKFLAAMQTLTSIGGRKAVDIIQYAPPDQNASKCEINEITNLHRRQKYQQQQQPQEEDEIEGFFQKPKKLYWENERNNNEYRNHMEELQAENLFLKESLDLLTQSKTIDKATFDKIIEFQEYKQAIATIQKIAINNFKQSRSAFNSIQAISNRFGLPSDCLPNQKQPSQQINQIQIKQQVQNIQYIPKKPTNSNNHHYDQTQVQQKNLKDKQQQEAIKLEQQNKEKKMHEDLSNSLQQSRVFPTFKVVDPINKQQQQLQTKPKQEKNESSDKKKDIIEHQIEQQPYQWDNDIQAQKQKNNPKAKQIYFERDIELNDAIKKSQEDISSLFEVSNRKIEFEEEERKITLIFGLPELFEAGKEVLLNEIKGFAVELILEEGCCVIQIQMLLQDAKEKSNLLTLLIQKKSQIKYLKLSTLQYISPKGSLELYADYFYQKDPTKRFYSVPQAEQQIILFHNIDSKNKDNVAELKQIFNKYSSFEISDQFIFILDSSDTIGPDMIGQLNQIKRRKGIESYQIGVRATLSLVIKFDNEIPNLLTNLLEFFSRSQITTKFQSLDNESVKIEFENPAETVIGQLLLKQAMKVEPNPISENLNFSINLDSELKLFTKKK